MPSLGPLTIPEADHYFEFRGCDASASKIFDLKDPSVNASIINGPIECSDSGLRVTWGQWMDVTPFKFGGVFTVEMLVKLSVLSDGAPLLSFADNRNGLLTGAENGVHFGSSTAEIGWFGGAFFSS